jgi:GDSL-like Lipase/Acylhydrolase family
MKKRTIAFAWIGLLIVTGRAAWCADAEHNFAKWEKEIAAFEESDRQSPPPTGAVVFTGSSTIARWKTLAADFPELPVIDRGFGGSEIVDCTHFAPRIVFPYQPRMVVFRCGGNDLHAGKSVEQVFADFKEFASAVRKQLPQTEIVVISLCPSIARWSQRDQEKDLNKLVEDYIASQSRMKYIECYSVPLGADGQPRPELFVADKLHFNAEGYKLLTERVRPQLKD